VEREVVVAIRSQRGAVTSNGSKTSNMNCRPNDPAGYDGENREGEQTRKGHGRSWPAHGNEAK